MRLLYWRAGSFGLCGSLMRLICCLVDFIKFYWLIAAIGCCFAAPACFSGGLIWLVSCSDWFACLLALLVHVVGPHDWWVDLITYSWLIPYIFSMIGWLSVFSWLPHTIGWLSWLTLIAWFYPFKTAVPFWRQTTRNLSGLPPKRGCTTTGAKRLV